MRIAQFCIESWPRPMRLVPASKMQKINKHIFRTDRQRIPGMVVFYLHLFLVHWQDIKSDEESNDGEDEGDNEDNTVKGIPKKQQKNPENLAKTKIKELDQKWKLSMCLQKISWTVHMTSPCHFFHLFFRMLFYRLKKSYLDHLI